MEDLQNVYDDNDFFNEYKKMRESKINANELLEIPVIKKMLPSLNSKKILDLGCGAGEMSRYFADNGAKHVLGVDISKNMLSLAEKLTQNSVVEYKNLPMEDISEINETFDMVFSSLAFHYIEDFDALIKNISNLLSKGGELVFSQEHPISTAIIRESEDCPKSIDINNKKYYLISDYNNNGKRLLNWNIENVLKYHRNFSSTINALVSAGFKILEVQESKATEEAVRMVEKYKYQQDRPYFLFIKAIKE